MNLADAAYHVVHDYPGGSESLAPRIGKNPTTLSHEVARVGMAKLGLETAAQITEMSGDMRILQSFALRCRHMTLPLPTLDMLNDDACIIELGKLLKEVGDLVSETTTCLHDGKISDNETARLDMRCGRLVSCISVFMGIVHAKNAATKRHQQLLGVTA